MNTPLQLLAIGPHPDDVELFCGGTVIDAAQRGRRVGVLDLTEGEMASNGTVEQRRAEAAAAAEVMGLARRDNLGLPDGGLRADDPEQVRRAAQALRRLRPEVLLIPWSQARHPDHEAASALMRRAVFTAGLRKADCEGEPHRVRRTLLYQMRVRFEPNLLVDISSALEAKARAIACHGSQVRPGPDAAQTLVGAPAATAAIEARDRYYGAALGVTAAEPFRTEAAVGVRDLVGFVSEHPFDAPLSMEPLP